VIECIDTGIGIDENKINFIFEDFTQEEMSTTRKYGGTGLGLSIVKKLVELHNGTIDLKSRKNQGTMVSCHLPYLVGDERQVKIDIEKPLNIPEEIRNLKILIVDDEEYNRLLFKTILDRWKIDYRDTSNGMEALEMLRAERYNLLFMDVRMPGIDGLKTTRIIRDEMNISASEMPVICISATPVNEHWLEYRNAGMNAFLPKPFTEEMLLKVVLSVYKDKPEVKTDNTVIKGKNIRSDPEKINLLNLYHISGGDEKFVKQMLVSFIDTTRKGLNEMQKAVLSGEGDSVIDLAHKLIPPCRHIGASDLCDLLRKIEESNRNGSDVRLVETLTMQSISEFETIHELLQAHIAKID
jgi:CheY-like chemotaxis protein/HPt (histidine-containing phosphotransfer) domain-containing protein